MFRDFGRAAKVFLLGILFGVLFSIFSKLFFESGIAAAQAVIEARFEVMPVNRVLLTLAIFLNNLLVVAVASMGSVGIVLLFLWGRKELSLWKKLDDSRFSRILDRYIWRVVGRFKPAFNHIENDTNRDIFVLVYGLPALVMIVNGWILGFFFADAALEASLDGTITFLKLVLPHGIIEFPAIVASAAMGFSLADDLLPFIRRDNTQETKEKAVEIIGSADRLQVLLVLLGLLAIAAYFEVYLTPRLV